MSRRYPPELQDYIKEHVEAVTQIEMCTLVREQFEIEMSEENMKNFYANHKLRAGKRKPIISKVWPEKVQAFILDNYKGKSHKEMVKMISDQFGLTYTTEQLKSFYGRKHLDSGLTGYFEKGQKPWTAGKKQSDYMTKEQIEKSRRTCYKHAHIPDSVLPVGAIRQTKDGYLIIKVKERGGQWDRWALLHRKVWEEVHGSIPDGYAVGFRDQDKTNCSIENLYLLTLEENAVMNHQGYRSQNPELTDAGLMTVRLKRAISKRRKRAPNNDK